MSIKDRISKLKTGAKVLGMIPKRYKELVTGKKVLSEKDKKILADISKGLKSK